MKYILKIVLGCFLINALLFIFNNKIFAQAPAHFVLGADEFKGIQIYDIIQDNERNYWIATNDGLYFYDYQKFSKVLCKEATTISVFNFKKNLKGAIYCHNLNNQIFELKDRQCRLFYELKDDEAYPDISLSISDANDLVIGARKILVINTNRQLLQRFENFTAHLSEPFLGKDNEIYFPIAGSQYLIKYSRKRFSKIKLNIQDSTHKASLLKFFLQSNTYYAIDLNSKQLYDFDIQQYLLKPTKEEYDLSADQRTRVYETGDEIWLAATHPGVDLYTITPTKKNHQKFFSSYYISNVYKDAEGNYLLTTFDKGIIVVPDLGMPEIVQSFYNDPITATYTDADLGLLLGTSKGEIIQFKNNIKKTLSGPGLRSIQQIYGSPKSDFIIFDDGEIRAYNKNNGAISRIIEKSLKDIAFVSRSKFYVGTNSGIYKASKKKHHYFELDLLSKMNNRIYALSYDNIYHQLYAASSSGLYIIDSNDVPILLQHNSQRIFANKLFFNNGKTFATVNNSGIVVFEKGKIEDTLMLTVNGNVEQVMKMIFWNKTILAKTANGLYQFDTSGKMLKPIHSIFGFAQKRVLDFALQDDMLWVSHSGGLQQVDFRYGPNDIEQPSINISKLLINDSERKPVNNIKLNSQERKISFEFCVPTLRNRETIHYYYRLLGYDNRWNVNYYKDYAITYNALSAGKYTLEVKAENLEKYSYTISYTFYIIAPFYTQWWFIGSAMLLFVAVVYWISRWQIKQQQTKTRQQTELNNSKLTAIKSQMNPHFIFNSLNSIQDLILKGDIENSYSCITTFSNLVRSTLNHSEQDFIDFEHELKLIELYLSLEKLRFKKNLHYTIYTNGIEDILLPPLIIQPFIENALVHGLLHKVGEKKLIISFELNDALVCTIEDNGIGRAQAKMIKHRQQNIHESFSGKAIRKRFDILNSLYKGQYGFEFIDLHNGKEAIGTKVVLTIPIKHKF